MRGQESQVPLAWIEEGINKIGGLGPVLGVEAILQGILSSLHGMKLRGLGLLCLRS